MALNVGDKLQLYNTLTRQKETFHPIDNRHVKMASCGPSTYQHAHIGNYRTFLYEDILQRYLEYLGYQVTRVMTLTDVEDKAVAQAKKENLPLDALTDRNLSVLFSDFELLKIKCPTYPIKASNAVDQAVALINLLVRGGYAYWYTYRGAKNAYFEPFKFKGFGKLAHLDMSKWPKRHRRFHKDTYPGTPWNMGDFVLWHGCQTRDVCYDTPIGRGRPAWNIQDAAIITQHLGFSIDLACGGIDNLVRHHDYTIAIAEAASGKQFSRFWLHGGHLLVDGEKMSKSKGNVYYPRDLTAKGYSGAEIRFFLIYGPYREKLNFTFERLAETSEKLRVVRRLIAELQSVSATGTRDAEDLVAGLFADFEKCMSDDLDVRGAFDSLTKNLGRIFELRGSLSGVAVKRVLDGLLRVDLVLGCLF
ncbi:MAG: class I tRNA ligase family protein [Candidatus Bathyarchaeota archaeon]|nr:class I tRNA ligase family protein [Candidatus Bathyarchaeota archaeon]